MLDCVPGLKQHCEGVLLMQREPSWFFASQTAVIPIARATFPRAQIVPSFTFMFCLCCQPSGRCITDDGSFTPSMDKPEQALDFVQDVVSTCGYSLGTDVQIALNCAASEFYDQVRKVTRQLSTVSGTVGFYFLESSVFLYKKIKLRNVL